MPRPRQRFTAIQAVQYFQGLDSDDSGEDDELDDSDIDASLGDDTDSDEDDNLYSLADDDGCGEDLVEKGASSNSQNVVISKDSRTWNIVNNTTNVTSGRVQQHNVFKVKSGPSHVCRGIVSPENAWQLIIDQSMLEYIRECTIDYARNVVTENKPLMSDWDVSLAELRAFLGLMYLRGVLHLKNFEEDRLWSQLPGLECFSLTMSRNRYRELKSMMRFDKKSKRSQRLDAKKFALMGEIVDRFQANSQRAYSPEFSLTVDEQLFPCKSRCKYTQYMPNKPDKYGIKFWLLAELQSKYCLAITPYCGADGSRVESLGTHVVLHLMTPYLNKGYNVCCDNFFTNVVLAEKLANNGTSIVGTVRGNRREIPTGKANLDIHESEFFETTMDKGNVANLVRYQTKNTKSVLLLSTMHRGCAVTSSTKKKPASIVFYNSNKCGVDLLDSMARMHSTKSPMRRWPMAVWCNILDLAGVNAWILFSKETGRKISRWDFIHTLALDLIKPEIERRRRVERPSAGPGGNVSRKRRNCAVRKGCKNNKTMETCRKCYKAMCGRCQSLICIDCADDNE